MLMLLKESVASPLPKVFAVFGAFWVFVWIVLFFGIGALIRKSERPGKHH